MARLRFSPDILRRLGEELNPSLEHGVIELVKNAHDADARHCRVRLIGVSRPGGSIHVSDDGDGMTAADVVDCFLLLGRSAKVDRVSTPRGRTLAGSKGLGRLAALRAGRWAELKTRPRSEPGLEHRMTLDWSAFDAADAVDDVEVPIQTVGSGEPSPASSGELFSDSSGESFSDSTGELFPENTDEPSPDSMDISPYGTDISIRPLNARVGRREVKKLARAMLLLADPFGDNPSDFRVSLDSPEFRDLEELVRKKYFEDAEYSLRVDVDAEGLATACVKDWKGDILYTASHDDLRRGGSRYQCPPSRFDLWVFILNAKTFQTRRSSVGDVRKWLGEFGGVMLYVDGIRVPPYGDPGNDWLDMNLRRTRSPEERPGTNTSLGRIRVTDRSKRLTEKTDRSGMIESPAFADLRRMAQDGLDWMARQRLKAAETRRRATRKSARTETSKSRVGLERAIQRIAEEQESTTSDIREAATSAREAFERYTADAEREKQAMREEVQLYRTLSTAGIAAATFAHESSGGPLKVIARALSALRRRLGIDFSPMPAKLTEPLEGIGVGVSSLEAFNDTTLGLVDRDKRRAGRVDVHHVVKAAADLYQPFMSARSAELDIRLCDADPYLRGSVAAIEAIVVNLLSNALVAVAESEAPQRLVRLTTRVGDRRLTLHVADNGPGVVRFKPSEIWLPGVTSRPGGSGLGLTIVKDTVTDLGGEVKAIEHGRLGGAEFVIALPVIGS